MTSFAPEQYKEALIFLGTAGVAAPLFRRLKISPVLGFLCAVGALQLFGSAAAIGVLAVLMKASATSAAILGFAVSLSSTAIVIPVLAEAKRLGTTAGRTIFAVLLFQDLMVAPLLFMVTMLGMRGGGVGTALVSFLVPALTGLTVLVIGGHFVMRPLFRHVVAAGSTEFFVAACLFVVIGTGVVTASSGLSMGLGAFVAGILLAETEYRREIEVTIDPFRGLLLGLFFVSIGSSLNLSKIFSAPLIAFGLALSIILVKFCVNWLTGLIAGLPARIVTEAALMMAPGGEFAFVIITSAVAAGAVPASIGADAMVAVTLSMLTIPALGAFVNRIAKRPAPTDFAGIPTGKVIASIHEKRDEFRKILQPPGSNAETRHELKMSFGLKELRLRQPKSTGEE